jgi:hypothetical protein
MDAIDFPVGTFFSISQRDFIAGHADSNGHRVPSGEPLKL